MANIFQQFAQPVRSVSDYLGDYQQQEGNKLALAAKRMQMQQAEQGAADEQAARTAYMQSGGDPVKYRNALTQLGNYKGVQALDAADLAAQKSRGEIGKLGAETDDKRMATAQKRIETAGQVFGFVKDNPTADNAIAAAQHLGEQGIWDAATVAKAVQSIQANPTPENVRNLATQAYQNALSAKDQLPQLFNQNRGGTFGVKSVNPVTGAAKDVSVDAITQSADNAASQATALARIASSEKEGAAQRGVQIRGQNLSNEQALMRDKTTRDTAGAIIGKPLTEGQAKAALFGSRMEAANQVFDELATKGVTTSVPGSRNGYGVGAVVNAFSSADQQRLDQAKRDFINATLRRESGAVINENEFANGEMQYFPQIGDKPAVIAQKKRNREIAMRGIQAEVPEGRKEVLRQIQGVAPDAVPGGGFKYLGTE